MAQPKGSLVIAIGKMKPKGMPHDEEDMHHEDSEHEVDPGLVASMEDFKDALKAGDAEEMAKAFKDAHEICKGYEDEDEEGEEDHEEESKY